MRICASWTLRAWLSALGSVAMVVTTPATAQSCIGDLNRDDGVDGADLAFVLGGWGPCPGCVADINDDGIVDGNDLALVLGQWGPCPSPIVAYSIQTIEQPGMAMTDAGQSNTLIDFGLQFDADASALPHATPIIATRFAIWAQSVPAVNPFSADPADQVTGGIRLSLATPLNGIWNRFTGQFQMQVMLEGHYWLLDEYRPPGLTVCTEEGASDGQIAIEPWMGMIQGFAIESVDPETGDEILLMDYELHLQPASSQFPTFLGGGAVSILTGGVGRKKYVGLETCANARKSNKLVVVIQPVCISIGGGQVTGARLAQMKSKADEIWGKCCIEFEWLAAKTIGSPAWAEANPNEVNQIFEHPDMDPRNTSKVVEVCFVSKLVSALGQDHHYGDGISSLDGRLIVADQATSCVPPADGVLAHELGHAIGPVPHDGPSDPPSVMKPSTPAPGTNCPAVRPTAVYENQCKRVRRLAPATEKHRKEPCCQTYD